jgi:hypothetical protein
VLLPIQNQENFVWQQYSEVVSDLKGMQQYLFNLQHNTTRTGMQQRMRLMAYEESAITTTHFLERLRHENAILRSGACPPSKQDRELQDVYYRLSDTEHGWNYTRMLLDITREEVDIRTHGIVHLEHHVEA